MPGHSSQIMSLICLIAIIHKELAIQGTTLSLIQPYKAHKVTLHDSSNTILPANLLAGSKHVYSQWRHVLN